MKRIPELRDLRFEERELYETAQRVLSPEALGAVAAASRAQRG
jgi:hypothetical protein